VVDEVLYPARRERPLVSIVLPAYGEAAILHDHVVELLEYLKTLNRGYRFEIIIVNDGSRDQTARIATQLAAEFDGVRVFHHPRNFGLGQALKTGFAQCRGQYVIVLDIDLSYGPEHVGLLLNRITQTGARMVLASPYMRGGRVVDVPWLRVVFSRVANWFLARASGQRISTMTCMVRAIDGRFLRSLHLRSTGMDVMPEMIHKAKLLRASIEEIPDRAQLGAAEPCRSQPPLEPAHLPADPRHDGFGFILRPFTFLLVPGLMLIAFAAYVDTWMVIHVMEAYAELGIMSGSSLDMTDAFALAYARYPHTFLVGLLSLMLSMQLIGMAMLSAAEQEVLRRAVPPRIDSCCANVARPTAAARTAMSRSSRTGVPTSGPALPDLRMAAPYLVTGCAGFLGSNLLGRMLGAGHEVVGIDNLSMGLLDNLAEFRDDGRFRFVQADVTDPAALAGTRRPVRGCRASRGIQDPALRQGDRYAEDQLPRHRKRARTRAPPRLQARACLDFRRLRTESEAALQRGRQRPRHRQLEVAALGLRRLQAVRRAPRARLPGRLWLPGHDPAVFRLLRTETAAQLVGRPATGVHRLRAE
jgi:hypothetical protein